MAKKFIGIDIDGNGTLRVALATEEKGTTRLQGVAEHPLEEGEKATALLPGLVGDLSGFGNRAAAALPAGRGFVRTLHLPFADAKKVAAVLPFELSAQLPVAADACVVDFLRPLPAREGYTVTAAAVPEDRVRETLGRLEGDALPLHILDLSPYAFAGGLRGRLDDGLLVCLGGREVSLLLVCGGAAIDQRRLPPADPALLAPRLMREAAALQHAAGRTELPFVLIGAGAGELRRELEAAGAEAGIPEIDLGGSPVPPEFLPAAVLALRASAADREAGFNLRRGPFALRNEWAALKKRLIAAGLLLFLAVGAGLGGAYGKYAQKARRAEHLERQMTALYRETFPDAQVIIDIPRQMRSGINELQKRGALMGAGSGGSALAALREISSRIPEEITVDVRELSYSAENLRLEGITASFEAVNRMARSLERSPLFAEVQITDAKMSVDGGRVDFRLNIPLGGGKEGS